jgi:transitional endoplasmic reticulum ATPase
MLLEGPPGTGKTEVVMEVCRELYGSVPVQISGPEILSRWVGESERILRERFETAREDPSGVLYIDEVDAIARSRGQSTQEYSDQIVAQLLVLLDGLDSKRSSERVKVIASTNMAGMIDDALCRPGRLGRTELFDTLDGGEAVAVLHHYLDEIRHHIRQSDESTETGELSSEVHQFIEERDLSALEESTDEIADEGLKPILSGRTGADIEKIVQEAIRIVDENSEDDGSAAELAPRDLLEAATT